MDLCYRERLVEVIVMASAESHRALVAGLYRRLERERLYA
jgi:hypothetical protein